MAKDRETMPIKEVCKGLYDGPHATPKPADAGPIFLGIKNIREDGMLDLSNIRHISEEDYPKWIKRVKPTSGDIVFSYEATLNRYTIIPKGFRGCLGRRMALIRPNNTRISTRFLYYYFFSNEWRSVVSQNTLIGSTVDRIPLTQFPDFPIIIPPLDEQTKIAAILSAYDDLIENNLRRIKILEEMAQNLYREWFVNFRFPGHSKVRFVDSPLGRIPEGWEIKRLGELLSGHIGGGWGKDEQNDKHTEPAWVIRGTDIPNAKLCDISNVPFRYHTVSNLKTRKLLPGDIIFEVSGGSKGQPLGRVLLVSSELLRLFKVHPVICASFCKRIQPNFELYVPEILYLSFIEGYGSGEIEQYQVQSTGISNFKWSDYVEKVFRSVPPRFVQDSFLEIISPMLSKITILGLKNYILRQTRDLLLPKLISGELDVSELNITFQEVVKA